MWRILGVMSVDPFILIGVTVSIPFRFEILFLWNVTLLGKFSLQIKRKDRSRPQGPTVRRDKV